MVTVRSLVSRVSCSAAAPILAAAITFTGGCGQETDDLRAFASEASAALRSAPGDVAACRHWAICEPANPCHVGQVTGCRANVPICTDIGAWRPNGTSCGTDMVCRRGECMPCDAGASCTPLDPYGQPAACSVGSIACNTGAPVCKYVGPAPDGTQCGGDPSWVCKAEACTWCLDGSYCQPADLCHQGVVESCSTGGTCTDYGQPQPNGTWCGDGMVCGAGTCGACAWWSTCDTGIPCVGGYTDCSSGAPVCLPYYSLPDGTPCPGGVCQWGSCVAACTPGESCTPLGNPCATGQRVCDYGGGFCQETGIAPDGTPCGDQLVCSAGSCAPCGPLSTCTAASACQSGGTVSCATGQCEPSGPTPPDGTICGPANETCSGGFCRGAVGNPLLIRTATGPAMNVAGTAWTACYWDEPLPGMSRRAVDGFGESSFFHGDLVFPFSLDCTGPTAQSLGMLATGSAMTEGDRYVGWFGTPPPGLPSLVTATATYVSVTDGAGNVFSLKNLFFVNDLASPAVLLNGEGKNGPLAADGYPSVLSGGEGRAQLPACTAGAACQGMGGPCRTWSIGCDYSAAACLETGLAADGTSCGLAGETCVAGDCVGADGVALVVRTASGGSLDLTGTLWATCRPGEPEPWMSRRKTNAFLAGGATVGEEIFASSTDCSGTPDPILSWQTFIAMVPSGDRFAGWRGPIPAGLPATLLTTGIQLSGQIPGAPGPFTAKDLVLVDTAPSPWRLYTGEDDNPTLLDAEGYPAYMLGGAFLQQ